MATVTIIAIAVVPMLFDRIDRRSNLFTAGGVGLASLLLAGAFPQERRAKLLQVFEQPGSQTGID